MCGSDPNPIGLVEILELKFLFPIRLDEKSCVSMWSVQIECQPNFKSNELVIHHKNKTVVKCW